MEQIDLRDYIIPLRRWWWLLLAATLIAMISSYVVTQFEPQRYESRATVMVGGTIRNPNPNGYEFFLAQQLVTTYTDLVQRTSVRNPTMKTLGLDWLPSYSARAVAGTQLMELKVIDTDPLRAKAVVDELMRQLILVSPAGAQEQSRNAFVDSELDALQAAIIETKAEIDRRQGDLANMFSARQIADAQSQIRALEDKLTSLQTNYTALLATTQKGAVNALTVVEQASMGAPIADQTIYKVLLAAAIGFMLAASGAYLIEYLDNTLKNTDEVKRRLGLSTLAAIPLLDNELKSSPAFMMQHSQTPPAEAFRVLRTNLRFTAAVHPIQTLAVTSALPGEGKSMISANLAVALAQSGTRVILIDADLHRPRQHRIFGLVNNTGLTSALLNEDADARQFLRSTQLPTLQVLTSGPLPPNAAELVGSQRMHRMIAALRQHADVIMIDTPPCTVVADAAVISTQVDGVMLVVEVGRTNRDVARRAVDALTQVEAHIVGAVLNRMPLTSSGYYYSHYTYDRHYYRRDDATVETTPTVGANPFVRTARGERPAGVADGANGHQSASAHQANGAHGARENESHAGNGESQPVRRDPLTGKQLEPGD